MGSRALTMRRFLLTKFGEPKPWSVEEVQVLLAKMRADINNKDIHAYQIYRRVWVSLPLFIILCTIANMKDRHKSRLMLNRRLRS